MSSKKRPQQQDANIEEQSSLSPKQNDCGRNFIQAEDSSKRPRIEVDQKYLSFQVTGDPTASVIDRGFLEAKEAYAEDEMLSLREWLCREDRVIDRVANLHIFRQVLEYVHLAHSQGVVIRNLRPSCLVLSSFHRVSFINSSSTRSSSDKSSENSTGRAFFPCHVTDRDKKRASRHMVRSRFEEEPLSGGSKGEGLEGVSGRGLEQEKGHHVTQNTPNRYRFSKGYPLSSDSELLSQKLGGGITTIGSCSRGKPEINDEKLTSNSSCKNFSEDSSGSIQNQFPLRQALSMEQSWYTSPEELATGNSSFPADIYSLGTLFFELFCSFSLDMEWSRSLSDLRHRVLPPKFLSGHPKEAALCLWLLHPEPSSRPSAKELLQCELLNEADDALAERQAAVDLEEKALDIELLLEFLLRLQRVKEAAAEDISKDVACLTADIEEIEKRRIVQRRAPDTKNVLEEILGDSEKREKNNALDAKVATGMNNKAQTKTSQLVSNFEQLERVYFSMRWQIDPPGVEKEPVSSGRPNHCVDLFARKRGLGETSSKSGSSSGLQYGTCAHENNASDRLGYFFDSLCKYARYKQFKLKTSLKHGELLNQGNMVCSLSFDRDEEYFATAGVCKNIKVFECEAVLNEHVDIHYPVVELTCKSKISSICWNSYIKSYVSSSDYDGLVQLWDANTSQPIMEYKGHKKRVWSVDFSHVDPTKLASGSDDFCVKLWSINQETSIQTIKSTANICCVQFPTDSPHLLACGSADYKIYCYDLRNTKQSICILGGHEKAVSYVRFVDPGTLLSASTDNTLKLWNLDEAIKNDGVYSAASLTYTGHMNEKNFVGLSIADGYIACGSETNEVFAYHKSLHIPITSHKFSDWDPVTCQQVGADSNQFVSSVCWRGKSQTLVAANSVGKIEVLELV